jgi:hypothetical protein
MAVPFDLRKGIVTGPLVSLQDDVAVGAGAFASGRVLVMPQVIGWTGAELRAALESERCDICSTVRQATDRTSVHRALPLAVGQPKRPPTALNSNGRKEEESGSRLCC